MLLLIYVFRYQTYFDEVKQLYYRVSGKNLFCSIAIVLYYQLRAVVVLYTLHLSNEIPVDKREKAFDHALNKENI